MKKSVFFLSFILALAGCADKKYIHEPLKNELLAYTSKSEIIDAKTNILIVATYLNPIYSELIDEQKREKFVVAVHPKEAKILDESFSANGSQRGIMVRRLTANDPLLEKVSFEVPWAQYFEVSTPEIKSDRININFEIYPSKQVSLSFQKVSKSMYWNGEALGREHSLLVPFCRSRGSRRRVRAPWIKTAHTYLR